jgi:RND family efflux transporter MFP subunit
MIVFLLVSYLVVLFALVKLKVVPFNLLWKLSPLIVLLVLTIGLFIPMNWGAPQGPMLVVRNAVAIVPDVSGEVTDVPVTANTPLKAGDVLFRIDPVPYESQLGALQARFKLGEQRLGEITDLMRTGTGREFDVEQRQAQYDELKAQVEGAKWNLDKTVVRAPSDGYVTNLGLRKGARVANLPLSPVMAFIDTSDTIIGVEIAQIFARYIEVGQPVEVTFKFIPGTIYTGKVEAVLQAIASGQVQATGTAVTPKEVQSAPFVVRVRLDDQELANRLPAGSTGDAAIYTEHVKVAHIIRKVVLRQTAILNYIIPF